MPLIEIKSLTKNFQNICVFKDLSLHLEEGETFGILGPNGSGKTTLIKCLMQFYSPSSGTILFRGRPVIPADIHKSFGYLPEHFLPPAELNAREFLGLLGRGFFIKSGAVQAILNMVGLDATKKIRGYSRGMIQRLGLAIALLKDPEVIVLDEPTLGLDPIGQSTMLDLLKDLKNRGKTIFFSSHNIFHVQSICRRVAIINHGELLAFGPVAEILGKQKCSLLEEAFLKIVHDHAKNHIDSAS